MTVKELIDELKKYDQNLEVYAGNDFTRGVHYISSSLEDVPDVGKCVVIYEDPECVNPDWDC